MESNEHQSMVSFRMGYVDQKAGKKLYFLHTLKNMLAFCIVGPMLVNHSPH